MKTGDNYYAILCQKLSMKSHSVSATSANTQEMTWSCTSCESAFSLSWKMLHITCLQP